MSGFSAFVVKEFFEIAKTWRIWVLPGLILFFAVTSPPLARLAPALVSKMLKSQPGVVIQLPEPVAADAYRQFLKNLNQIVLIAIVIAAGGCISAERKSGTAVLALTKPLSRGGFVLAKMLSQAALVGVSTVAGAALCGLVTMLVFGDSPVERFASAVAAWLVYAVLLVVVMTLLSAALESQGGAIGFGFAVYLVGTLLAAWPAAARYTPAGLLSATSAVLGGQPCNLLWPMATTLVLAAALVFLAVSVFRRKEL